MPDEVLLLPPTKYYFNCQCSTTSEAYEVLLLQEASISNKTIKTITNMKSFISEDNIEQAICNRLSLPEYGWKRIECDARVEAQDDVSTTGRANPSECILPDVLFAALKRLNPKMDEDKLKGILKNLRKDFTGTDMIDTNLFALSEDTQWRQGACTQKRKG